MGCTVSVSEEPTHMKHRPINYVQYNGYGADYTNYAYYQTYYNDQPPAPHPQNNVGSAYDQQAAWNEYTKYQQYQQSLIQLPGKQFIIIS